LIGNRIISARHLSYPKKSRHDVAVPDVSTLGGNQSLTTNIGLHPKKNIGTQPHRVFGKTRRTFQVRLAVSSGSAYKN
jgi:hypothetical protein